MAEDRLRAYVKRMKQQGYASSSIKQALLAEGYSPERIAKVMGRGISKQFITVAIISALVVVVFTTLFLLFWVIVPDSPDATVVLRLDVPPQAAKGIAFSFRADTQADTIQYTVTHQRTREVIKEGQEKPGLISFDLPESAQEGEYKVIATAFANGAQNSAEASFIIPSTQTSSTIPQSDQSQGVCQGGCNDFNICTKDVCSEGVCQFTEITPCCGNNICEAAESSSSCAEDCATRGLSRGDATRTIFDQAKELSNSEPLDAAQLCRSLPRQADIDTCLGNIAKQSDVSAICGQIRDPLDRDVCYMDFAIKRNQFNVCGRIQDRTLRNGCISVGQLKKAPTS